MEQPPQIEESFLQLYDQCADGLFRHCYFRVSSRELAEDLTQESFMRTWNYLAEGKTIANPKAFLYRTAGNLIIDHYRRKKESSLDALAEGGFDPEGDDEQSVMQKAFGREVLVVLDQLDDRYREVITMRYVSDLSISEIAAALGETENTVSVRIHRGIERLRKIFHHEKPN